MVLYSWAVCVLGTLGDSPCIGLDCLEIANPRRLIPDRSTRHVRGRAWLRADGVVGRHDGGAVVAAWYNQERYLFGAHDGPVWTSMAVDQCLPSKKHFRQMGNGANEDVLFS